MSNGNSTDPEIKRAISEAIEDARDGELHAARLASIRQLLLTSPIARRYYLECNELNYLLASDGMLRAVTSESNRFATTVAGLSRGGADHARNSLMTRRLVPAATILTAVAALVLLTVMTLFRDREASRDTLRVIASLEQVNGSVRVTTAAAETPFVAQNSGIRSGDTIRTQSSFSYAVLAYPDGTRLSPVGNTSLTASDDGRKSVVFHSGALFGSVVAQPVERPLLVVTPQDKVEVQGARFTLDATTEKTDLSVKAGRVRLTRLQDGKTVEVPAGRRVVSRAASELIVEPIPNTPDQWSEDFENGLPEGWGLGRFVAADLPAGSQGAVRAVRDASATDGSVAIVTQEEWTYGLFAVHEDTQLHLTRKMERPGWCNILILTRTADDDPPRFAGNYIYDQPDWFGNPGEWSTVSIPLSNFRPLPPSRDAFENAIPFQVVFSVPDQDIGLVIDRVWVTRGGVGTVEGEDLP